MELLDMLREMGWAVAAEVLVKEANKRWQVVKQIYTLLGSNPADLKTIHELAESVSVFHFHRQHKSIRDHMYEAAFDSGSKVIYLTIMSKHTLMKMPNRIEKAKASHTELNILTLNPDVGMDVMKALGRHLGEEATAPKQIRAALDGCQDYDGWKKLATDYPTVIKVLGAYLSTPTMQGILVLDDWAFIELLPYYTPPDSRPAMFLSASLDVELFSSFQDSFEKLLADSERICDTR